MPNRKPARYAYAPPPVARVKTSLALPPELITRLRILAAHLTPRRDVQDIVADAIRAYLPALEREAVKNATALVEAVRRRRRA